MIGSGRSIGQAAGKAFSRASFLFALLLLFLVAVPGSAAQDAQAKFTSVKGQVHVRPDLDKRAWQTAQLQTALRVMDHVRTQPDGTAIIGYGDASTFILKPETEIMLEAATARDTKVALAEGRIWVNVKQVAQDATLEIDMDQTVGLIKGTNITCSSMPGENRIQVLRGVAWATVRATGAMITLKAGEELIVRLGGQVQKVTIDVAAESEKWKGELSLLSDSIDLYEIPQRLREMRKREEDGFKSLSEKFMGLLGSGESGAGGIEELRKEAERYLGALLEDSYVLSSLHARLSRPDAGARSGLSSILKMIVEVSTGLQRYYSEVNRFLKEVGNRGTNSDLGRLWEEISLIWSDVEEYAGGRPKETGLSQDYYKGIVVRLNQASQKLVDCAGRVDDLMGGASADPNASVIRKQVDRYLAAIARAILAYSVVEIPADALREMRIIDDEIGCIMERLRAAIDAYNPTAWSPQSRLPASANIVGLFAQARRQYLNALRLYQSLMRSVKVIETVEQEEFQEAFEDVRDTYNEAGEVTGRIQDRLEELEHQIR